MTADRKLHVSINDRELRHGCALLVVVWLFAVAATLAALIVIGAAWTLGHLS